MRGRGISYDTGFVYHGAISYDRFTALAERYCPR
jgi:hypothetical protein